jgi:hypothetical protein
MRYIIILIFISLLSCNQNDTKQKELELKERELALKEKEFEQKQADTVVSKETIKKDTAQVISKSSSDIKTVILTSPTYSFGDVAHLTFKDNATHKEDEYEWEGNIPAINEIMKKCEDHDGCPALKGQAYNVTLKFKLMDIFDFDGASGEMKPTGKKEKRWVIIAATKVSK